MEEGRLPEAVLTYRQALLSHPDDPDLLSGLGLALAAQGRGRSAAGFLNRVATLKPDEARYKTTLARLVTRPQDGLALTWHGFPATLDSEPVGAAAAAGDDLCCLCGWALEGAGSGLGPGGWDIQAPAALVSPPAADAGQVWVGAENGSVYVFDAGSGQSLGSFKTGGAVYAAPALTEQFAYCASSDGITVCLGAHDPEDRLESADRRRIACQPRW